MYKFFSFLINLSIKLSFFSSTVTFFIFVVNISIKSSPSRFLLDPPNIVIYCPTFVKYDSSNKVKKIHIINYIGYAFDSIKQPDYMYFIDKISDKKYMN